MKDSVPEGSPCRISGDEFVCIVKNPDAASFEKKMERLRKTLAENDRIASFGYETGEGKAALKRTVSACGKEGKNHENL